MAFIDDGDRRRAEEGAPPPLFASAAAEAIVASSLRKRVRVVPSQRAAAARALGSLFRKRREEKMKGHCFYSLFFPRAANEREERKNGIDSLLATLRLGRGPGRLWPLAEDAISRAEPRRSGESNRRLAERENTRRRRKRGHANRWFNALAFFKKTKKLNLLSLSLPFRQKLTTTTIFRPAATSTCSPTVDRARSRP